MLLEYEALKSGETSRCGVEGEGRSILVLESLGVFLCCYALAQCCSDCAVNAAGNFKL